METAIPPTLGDRLASYLAALIAGDLSAWFVLVAGLVAAVSFVTGRLRRSDSGGGWFDFDGDGDGGD
jgi:hypothetical protein